MSLSLQRLPTISALTALLAGLSFAMPAQKAHAQNLGSLVAFYNFDSQNANNSSPRTTGYNGTLSNVTFSNSIARDGSGYSAVFNGSNSNVATGVNVPAMTTNTIGGWFYLVSDPNNAVQQLLSADNGNYNRGLDVDTRIGTGSSGTLQYSAFAGPSQGVVQSGVAANTGAWHFVASTYSSASSTLMLDVDGVMTTKTGVTFGATPNNLFIGYNPWNTGEYFNGYADDVFVYNTVLTNSDLNTIQSGGRNAIISGAAAPEPVSVGLALWGLLPTAGLIARRRLKA